MPTTSTQPPGREPSRETLDRLYALWLISTLLIALLVVVMTLLGSGRLRLHARRISEQAVAIERLRDDLARTRQELMELQAPLADTTPASQSPPDPVEEEREEKPIYADEPPETDAARPVTTDDDRVAVLLDAALRPSDEFGYELEDPDAADQALREGLDNTGDKSWSGKTWSRLAIVARLLDRDGPAETFAGQAIAANVFPRAYYELSARKLLAQGRALEVVVFANRIVLAKPGDPVAALLLADAFRIQGDLLAADITLDDLADGIMLSVHDKLRLGRIFVALTHWQRLDALLASFVDVPDAVLPRLNFLRAVLAIQQDRMPEALAILDNLLAEHPDDYDFRTWRGVALLAARQFQAAREALSHARDYPDRPLAWYWRGMLELRAGNPDQAVPFFEHALTASQRYAPAWEALGTIALNRGDLPTALQNLENAVVANPRRGSTHFLIAIIHAKTLQPSATADALRTAFRCDPALLDDARQTEVIRRLFTDEELDALTQSEP